MKKGGYQILDLKDVNLKIGSPPNILNTEWLRNNCIGTNKALYIAGLKVNDKKLRNAVVEVRREYDNKILSGVQFFTQKYRFYISFGTSNGYILVTNI